MPFLDKEKFSKMTVSRAKTPPPPPPPPKSPYEKRGGIPRKDFPLLFEKGPFSIPWSRNRGKQELKKMGGKALKDKFPGFYGPDISGKEIQREIDKLKKTAPQTQAERNNRQEIIARLEDARKRAGL